MEASFILVVLTALSEAVGPHDRSRKRQRVGLNLDKSKR